MLISFVILGNDDKCIGKTKSQYCTKAGGRWEGIQGEFKTVWHYVFRLVVK